MSKDLHRCPCCGYIYDEVKGDDYSGFPAGTTWAALPDTWECPDCHLREKQDFEPFEKSKS